MVNKFLHSVRNKIRMQNLECSVNVKLQLFRLSLFKGEGCWASDLRQLGSTDQRVGFLQESPPGALVIKRAVVCFCVAMRGAEVVTTPALVAGGQASFPATDEAML